MCFFGLNPTFTGYGALTGIVRLKGLEMSRLNPTFTGYGALTSIFTRVSSGSLCVLILLSLDMVR